ASSRSSIRNGPARPAGGFMVSSPYLSAREAIVYLRLDDQKDPRSALYRLIRDHQLPHGRMGGRYLFDRRELDAWVMGFGSSLERARADRRSAWVVWTGLSGALTRTLAVLRLLS